MKRQHLFTQLLFVLITITIVGCAATPEDRWYQQRESLNTANRIYLAHVPTMSDEQIVQYGELLQSARSQLELTKAQLPEGGSSFDSTLDLIESILVRIVALEAGDTPDVPPATTDNPISEVAPDERS